MKKSFQRPIRIRKFNPGMLQSDEEVINQFAARKREFGILLDVLKGNIGSPSCQHTLLIAPRGQGKTMLLARTAAEIRTDREMSERLLPVCFMEESQEIFSLADFWLESLFYLAKEISTQGPQFSKELRDRHASLAAQWRGDDLEGRARAVVLGAADRLGKQLVFMVENLQTLFGHVDVDFGWKLRKVLQSDPEIILLASAASRFKGLDDPREPFFEFFRILRLEPLDTGECLRLWQMVSGDAVSERKIRPLQILTGGNPRLLTIIGDSALHRSPRHLMDELARLIDDHTEYFRGYLQAFAKTERRVYLALIDLWQPSTTGEIAARARMDVRSVSTLLGRLVERGAALAEESGKKRIYSASERLHSIYYKLRREHGEEAAVRSLIRFMAAFYIESGLDERPRAANCEAAFWPAVHDRLTPADGSLRTGSFFSGETQPGIRRVMKGAAADREQATEVFGRITFAMDKTEFEEVIKIADQFLSSRSIRSLQAPDQLIASILSAKAFAHEGLNEPVAELAVYDEVIKRFGRSDESEPQSQVAAALLRKGAAQEQRGEDRAAVAAFDEMVARFGNSSASELQECVAKALVSKGGALERVGDSKAAIVVYDQVIKRFNDSDIPELQKQAAEALISKTEARIRFGRTDHSLRVCDDLDRRIKTFACEDKSMLSWKVKWLRAKSLLVQQRHRDMMEALDSVYAGFDSGEDTMISEMITGVSDLVAGGASESGLAELFSRDRGKAAALLPLILALRQCAGETVRAPAEMLEVAADVRGMIEAGTNSAEAVPLDTPAP